VVLPTPDPCATAGDVGQNQDVDVAAERIPIHFIHSKGKGPKPKPPLIHLGWPWTFCQVKMTLRRFDKFKIGQSHWGHPFAQCTGQLIRQHRRIFRSSCWHPMRPLLEVAVDRWDTEVLKRCSGPIVED
jgi:hypothetical protein